MQVHPRRGLGFLTLGASLHDILTRLKAQPHTYPTIDVAYSPSEPLTAPIILDLPSNGFRLRFDGPDQRLRLIEVLDFTKMPLRYNDKDLVKLPEGRAGSTPGHLHSGPTGPPFRQIYSKLGLTYEGEYIPPGPGSKLDQGLFVWSYPGVAFTFPFQHSMWSPGVHFVSELSSSATASAISMAIFDAHSWQEARQDLMTRPCPYPRSLALSSRGKEYQPDEIEVVYVRGNGKVDLERQASPPFRIFLGRTTPQDLVAELGPPDAVYRKYDRRLTIHQTQPRNPKDRRDFSRSSPADHDSFWDTDESSAHTNTDDSEIEDRSISKDNASVNLSAECFYNYFHHGFDVFISYPMDDSPQLSALANEEDECESNVNKLVATKILVHGNVPGCYPFNRYRRSRWVIDMQNSRLDMALDSETPFATLSDSLSKLWHYDADLTKRAMVLNRDFWGESPGSSCELLDGWEEGTDTQEEGISSSKANSCPGPGNSTLYGFPGLLFEVLENDAVSCLTVY